MDLVLDEGRGGQDGGEKNFDALTDDATEVQ